VLIEIKNVSNCLGRLFRNCTRTLNLRTETPGEGLPPKMDYFASYLAVIFFWSELPTGNIFY